MNSLRLLFVKESQNWPRASGHDVHGAGMMAALAAGGHAVSLATIRRPTAEALAGIPLVRVHSLSGDADAHRRFRSGSDALPPLQRKFADYYGAKDEWAAALRAILRNDRFDAVIVVAAHLLPLLAGVRGPVRVWYPADDQAWQHLSRVRVRDPHTWGSVRHAAVAALYERAFGSTFDRAWVVSPTDRTALRLLSGCRQVDLIPNGVDADHYAPQGNAELPASCAFWGRLDFGPNVDALEWFLRRVWPAVKAATPRATFDVFGFNPTARVRDLAAAPGVELHPDLPDLRTAVCRRQAVVLPFVTGGGIKNKLLEAAALGMPIVCTRWALSGTKGKPAVRVAGSATDWAQALAELWTNGEARRDLGSAARRWVLAHHTWDAAARNAAVGISYCLAATRSGAREKAVQRC